MTTIKEEKENLKQWKEDRERKFPVAVTNCPNCRKTIFFSAGEIEQDCPCGITVYRKAKE
jgi:hypothetical protein